MIKIEEMSGCRICGGELKLVYDFGELFISGFVKPGSETPKAPLTVMECVDCGLVQLGHTVDLDFLYKKQYWYASSLNKSMIHSLRNIAESVLEKVTLLDGEVVVDIGCNDGALFQFFPDNVVKVGYEPASNMAQVAESKCDHFINDFFYPEAYPTCLDKAKIITSIAVFYDLPNPHKFIEGIKDILREDGIWVIQLTDLVSMMKLNEFTSFCAEHLEYYKLSDLIGLINSHGLEVFDAEYNDTNGGSLRIYISHPSSFRVSPRFYEAIYQEDVFFSDPCKLKKFFYRISSIKDKIRTFLLPLQYLGTKVYGLGASTKGATLLQYFGLDNTFITAIGEVNSDKFGLITAGTSIPIISEQELLDLNPEYIFLIIWQFQDMMLAKLKPMIDKGLTVLVPLPEPKVYNKDGEFLL